MSKRRKVTSQREVKSGLVSYKEFFTSAVVKKLIKAGQEKELNAFFKDLGLSDKEPVDAYEDALTKY